MIFVTKLKSEYCDLLPYYYLENKVQAIDLITESILDDGGWCERAICHQERWGEGSRTSRPDLNELHREEEKGTMRP